MTIQEQILATKQPRRSSLITTGMALFSMFFGAGNLIFPLMIGNSVGASTWPAILGLSITAVVVPFIGLIAMVLYQANYQQFFGRIGKIPGIFLLLLLQLILGPLGVIPRLVTLMHAIAKPYLFDISLTAFSIVTVSVIFLCSIKRQHLIGLLGSILTPILLLSLSALVFTGLTNSPTENPYHLPAWDSFKQGLLGGYNTMDLIAAFLFATVILPHFQKEAEEKYSGKNPHSLLKKIVLSSLIAASLLFFTYIGLAWISSYHAWKLDSAYLPEELLGAIAFKILGPIGGAIAAVAIVTACLTTAITLTSIFADYLQKDLFKGKIKQRPALVLTLITTMLFANLGFSGIAVFLGPILQIVYPGLILLSILNLFYALYGFKMVKTPIFLTFGIGLVSFCIA